MKNFEKLIGVFLLIGSSATTAAAKPADTIAQRAVACIACHGKEGRATSDGFFPRIAGKPAGYLYNQLVNFRSGARSYPMMTYMVGHMSDDYLKEIAQYFSDQHPPYAAPQPSTASAQTLALGRRLVTSGDASRKLPACISCHGQALRGALPSIPGLLGLPRDYVNAQIGAWKNGARKAAAPDCMAHISKQLTAEEVGAVSSWLAAQPIARDMAPAASFALPTPCGSAPSS
ncbi:MAG: cytochrome c4 [Pseudomonadota bacterium]